MSHYLDVSHWVYSFGYFGLFAVVFIETGLFFGFFLPGDSLVVISGFLASQGILNIWFLVPLFVLTATLGYAVAYWFGKSLGDWLLHRRDSLFFKKRHIKEAHIFYEKHGAMALVIGRMLPIVRTFVPIAAGLAGMRYRLYMLWNFVGALIWGGLLCILGYALGTLIPNAEHYVLPSVAVIILISLLPIVWHAFKKYRDRQRS